VPADSFVSPPTPRFPNFLTDGGLLEPALAIVTETLALATTVVNAVANLVAIVACADAK
jgi:hypothetical protein